MSPKRGHSKLGTGRGSAGAIACLRGGDLLQVHLRPDLLSQVVIRHQFIILISQRVHPRRVLELETDAELPNDILDRKTGLYPRSDGDTILGRDVVRGYEAALGLGLG